MQHSIQQSTINNKTRFNEKSPEPNNDRTLNKHCGCSFIGIDDKTIIITLESLLLYHIFTTGYYILSYIINMLYMFSLLFFVDFLIYLQLYNIIINNTINKVYMCV